MLKLGRYSREPLPPPSLPLPHPGIRQAQRGADSFVEQKYTKFTRHFPMYSLMKLFRFAYRIVPQLRGLLKNIFKK